MTSRKKITIKVVATGHFSPSEIWGDEGPAPKNPSTEDVLAALRCSSRAYGFDCDGNTIAEEVMKDWVGLSFELFVDGVKMQNFKGRDER